VPSDGLLGAEDLGCSFNTSLIVVVPSGLIVSTFPIDPLLFNQIWKAPYPPPELINLPSSIYVNSSNHHIYCYLGGSWKQLD